jgi:hypothetical protein
MKANVKKARKSASNQVVTKCGALPSFVGSGRVKQPENETVTKTGGIPPFIGSGR